MKFYNDTTDEIDAELLKQALETDLIAVSHELIEMFGQYEFCEADGCEIDEVPGFELVQVDSGNEGDGNYMWSVVEFKLDGKSYGFVRIGGTYSSWDGSEYDTDDMTVVELVQVVKSEYIAADGSEDDQYDKVLRS